MLLRCENLEPPMSQLGHSLQVRPRPLVHKCPLCINTDRKFWALGFVDVPNAVYENVLGYRVAH